jgi:hypothetical protein
MQSLLSLYERNYAKQHRSHRKLREDNQFLYTYTEEQWANGSVFTTIGELGAPR